MDIVRIRLTPDGFGSIVTVGNTTIPGVNKVSIVQEAAKVPVAILEISCFEYDAEMSSEHVKALLEKIGVEHKEKEK
jgi:hypothetical protein